MSRLPRLDQRAVLLLQAEEADPLPGRALGRRLLRSLSVIELIEAVRDQDRPLVLIQGGALSEETIELAQALADLPARPVLAALESAGRMGPALTTARRLGLSAVFPAEALDYPEELETWAQWIERGGPEPGLAEHLAPEAPIRRLEVRDRETKVTVLDSVVADFQTFRPDSRGGFDLRLVLEEALNNAVYHAFESADGVEKYSIRNFETLEPGEEVTLDYGRDARTFAVDVADNQGRLRRDRALEKIERHIDAHGLLDERGRGLFLCHSLADRLIVNLQPGRLTQLVVLFAADKTLWQDRCPARPILVFEREGA